jgi:hypothetical protein
MSPWKRCSTTDEIKAGACMTMRVSTLVTHLRPQDALALIECLDQLRDALLQTYGEEIRALLEAAASSQESPYADDEVPF